MRRPPWLGIVAIAGMVGCAHSAPPPEREHADARAAIQAAERVGVIKDASGRTHLELARQRLRQAEEKIQDDEPEHARLLLEEAQVEAELAIALTKAARTRQRALRAEEQLDAVRAHASAETGQDVSSE